MIFVKLGDTSVLERNSVKPSRIKKVEGWACWAGAGQSFVCIGLGNNGESNVLGLANCTLGASFTIKLAIPDFAMSPPAKLDPGSNVLGLANCTLGESFTIKLANPRFRNVATSQTGSRGQPLRRRRPKNIFWAVCDIGRETFTQGAVGQAEPI
ncbi:hypothetical protein O0I10_012860, partial [Lichtheimia ornata]